jgi:hypothetical protein
MEEVMVKWAPLVQFTPPWMRNTFFLVEKMKLAKSCLVLALALGFEICKGKFDIYFEGSRNFEE